MSDARELLARYLRQRAELGEHELVLERHTRASLRAARRAASAPLAGAAAAAPAPTRTAREEAPPPSAPDASARPSKVDQEVSSAAPAPLSDPTERASGASAGAGASYPSAGAAAARPAPDAPARGASADEILALPTLQAVCEVALGCPRCALAKTRTRVAFGEGNEQAELMVVGEAPGENEDRQGRPFVGKAGRLLDLLLASAGFPRESVYICNVLKCRPPGNRNPEPAEVEACSPYLLRQIELVRPRVVMAFGTFAAQTLLESSVPIGQLRRGQHQYRGIPLVPTYHPAALLRNAGWVRLVWDDLQRARALLAA